MRVSPSSWVVLALTTFAATTANAAAATTAQIAAGPPTTYNDVKSRLTNLGFTIPPAAQNPPSDVTSRSLEKRVDTSSCAKSCKLLSLLLGPTVSQINSQSYNQQEYTYWSNQQLETKPQCRVQPTIPLEVSVTLLVSEFLQCPFAVKSGGHAAFAGASNIQGGITIDLAKLNEVTVSKDKTLTRVGAGNKWVDVYEKLDPQGLSVVGGRVSAIGVGGLTLGGGISFFSGKHGWACDGVRNYELVTASGIILNVNYQSYPDLYFALRGGGNNFGVVTRFDLETFAQGKMWGGFAYYAAATAKAAIFTAFKNFANNQGNDPDAALINSFAYAQGNYVAANDYEYAKPTPNPPIFHEFTSIPQISNTLRITTLTDLTIELNNSNPGGFRETYTTATFKLSPVLQSKIYDIWHDAVETIKDAEGVLPAITFQPITKVQAQYFKKNGGNALGIEVSDCPLMLMNEAIMWSDKADDKRIIAAAIGVVEKSVAAAKAMGLDFPYIYQNYASLNEDVFAGYGLENKQKLISISKKYDPAQVFEKLQPGYFKLSGGNGGSES